MKQCANCGTDFAASKYSSRQRFCSASCYNKSYAQTKETKIRARLRDRQEQRFLAKPLVVAKCKQCSVPIARRRGSARQKEYCSAVCLRRARRVRDLDKIKARDKRYYAANKDRIIAGVLKRARANPEAEKARIRAWTKTDNGRLAIKANAQKRRARERGADGSFTRAEFVHLCDLLGNRCMCCHQPSSAVKLVPDHIVALIQGGANDIGNIQPLCSACNARKGRETKNWILDFTPRDYRVAA